MASKKRRSGRGKAPRQGISGNPQRRAEQLAQRRPAIADEPDFSALRDVAYAMAGGANPRPWWDESYQRILAAARALTWPSRPVDLETQACQIVGDEFYERLNSPLTGLHPAQWLRALAEETGAALRTSVAGGTGDWRQLWALLCGLALTVPPGDTESKTAKLAREHFPDISAGAYDDKRTRIGRIFLSPHSPPDRNWMWTITAPEYPPTNHSHGYSATREDAMADFKQQWLAGSSSVL